MSETCKIKNCKNEVMLYYYNYGICAKHWAKYAEKDDAELKEELGIKEKKDEN